MTIIDTDKPAVISFKNNGIIEHFDSDPIIRVPVQRLYNSNETISVKWKTCEPDDLKGEGKANRSYL